MLKILVLEADSDNNLTIEHLIKTVGHRVMSVRCHKQFLEQVSHWQPHVVVIDLLLSNTDVITVLTELASSIIKPDVIVFSDYAHHRLLEAAARSAESHGFRVLGTITKPFFPKTLLQILNKYTTTQPVNISNYTPHNRVVSIAELELAFKLNSFYLVYQPKVDCRTTTVVGFEVLCRLNLPNIGEISPDQFIPLCEQYGLINKLTQFVIDTALPWFGTFLLHSASHIEHLNVKNIRLAINISAVSLEQSDIFTYLISQCTRYNISPSSIILELTETAAMSDPIESLDILTRLRLLGFHLSIDDFGTGYSSMLQLVRLPFSELKIDKHFVSKASKSKESRLVISSIIELAHSLGLYVTAEGIEDNQTLTFLQKNRCNAVQGFYIARPLTTNQVEHWINLHYNDKEQTRLKVLRGLNILDSPPEERFDRITRLAQRIFSVPMCTLSLLDENRIWYKSKIAMKVSEVNRKNSLCELAIQNDSGYFVHNTLQNPRTKHNTMVINEPFTRFYAGHPVKAPNGSVIGSLCLFDPKPRACLSHSKKIALQDLAYMLEEELATDSIMIRDPLTQLKNHTGFDQRASSLLKLCRNHQLQMHIFSIKIHFDSTERIDTFNFYYERVIKKTAKLLKKCFDNADLIARLEDNSFIIIYVAHDTQLIQLAINLFNSLNATEKSKQRHVFFNCIATELNCKIGEIESLQQLYMKLDTA